MKEGKKERIKNERMKKWKNERMKSERMKDWTNWIVLVTLNMAGQSMQLESICFRRTFLLWDGHSDPYIQLRCLFEIIKYDCFTISISWIFNIKAKKNRLLKLQTQSDWRQNIFRAKNWPSIGHAIIFIVNWENQI